MSSPPHDRDVARAALLLEAADAAEQRAAEDDRAPTRSKLHAEIAIPADFFLRAVAFDISQPEDVDVNEILFSTPLQQLELCTMRLGLRQGRGP